MSVGVRTKVLTTLLLGLTLTITCRCQTTVSELCFDEICYEVVELAEPLHWFTATAECPKLGLEAAVFFQKSAILAVENLLDNLDVDAWIGLRVQEFFTWRWYNGSYVSGVTLAVKVGSGNCISLRSGILYIDNCNSAYQCLCQAYTTEVECKTKNGLVMSDRCVYTTSPGIWVDCAKTCTADGGQIATDAIISNLGFASQVAPFYDSTTWIGITKSLPVWSRDSPLDPYKLSWIESGAEPNPNYESTANQCMKMSGPIISNGLITTKCADRLKHVICLKAPQDFVFLQQPTEDVLLVDTTTVTAPPTTTTITATTELPTTTTSPEITTTTTDIPTTAVEYTTTSPFITTTEGLEATLTTRQDLLQEEVGVAQPTLRTVTVETTSIPLWVLIAIILGVVALAVVLVALIAILCLSCRKKNKDDGSTETSIFSSPSVSTLPIPYVMDDDMRCRMDSVSSNPYAIPHETSDYQPFRADLKAQEEFSYPTTMVHDDMEELPSPTHHARTGTLQYHRDTLSSDYRNSSFVLHSSLPSHYSQVFRPRVGSMNTTLNRTTMPSWNDNSHIYGTIDNSRLGNSLYRTSNA